MLSGKQNATFILLIVKGDQGLRHSAVWKPNLQFLRIDVLVILFSPQLK